MNGDQVLFLLGQIKGELKSVNRRLDNHAAKLDGIDTRLRKVEIRAAERGAMAGGVMGVGVSLLVEAVRHAMKGNGA